MTVEYKFQPFQEPVKQVDKCSNNKEQQFTNFNTTTIINNILYGLNNCSFGYVSDYKFTVSSKTVERVFHIQTPQTYDFAFNLKNTLTNLNYTQQSRQKWTGTTEEFTITISYTKVECNTPDSLYEVTITIN